MKEMLAVRRIILMSFLVSIFLNLASQVVFEQFVYNLGKIKDTGKRTFQVSLVNQGKKEAVIDKIIIPEKHFDVQTYNPLLKSGEVSIININFFPDSTLTRFSYPIGIVIDGKQYDLSVKGEIEITPAAETPEKPLKRIDKDHYQLGNIDIWVDKGEISFPIKINMDRGPVEVVLCTPFGKTHESIFVAEVIPSFVQVALLLLDFNYSNAPENLLTSGEKLEIMVEWYDNTGTVQIHRLEEFLLNVSENKPMENTYWVFTGSEFWEKVFLADRDGSLVASYFDRGALINNPLESGNSDDFYIVNTSILPAKETILKINIKKGE